jgi:putative ABC transport system permease protein
LYTQLQFIKNKNLGFDKENLVYINMTGNLWDHQEALKTELKQNPLTANYAITQELPTNLITGTIDVKWEGKDSHAQFVFPTMAVDENFTTVFKMRMLNGRSFSKEFKGDTTNYVVNEKALKIMGMDVNTAIGKPLSVDDRMGTIVGVVQNFNFKPVQQAIEPLILRLNTWGGKVVVRTSPGNTEATLQTLEKICHKLNPAYPFSYNFLDQDLANL